MKELADHGIPVAVTCRVLELARQPYYRWLATPVTSTEAVEAYRAPTRCSTPIVTIPSSDVGYSPTSKRGRRIDGRPNSLADLFKQPLVECVRQTRSRQGRAPGAGGPIG